MGEHCTIHNPSEHHMREWPINFRAADGFMNLSTVTERICPCGVGHPDPDCPGAAGYVHACCGCCLPGGRAELEALMDRTARDDLPESEPETTESSRSVTLSTAYTLTRKGDGWLITCAGCGGYHVKWERHHAHLESLHETLDLHSCGEYPF